MLTSRTLLKAVVAIALVGAAVTLAPASRAQERETEAREPRPERVERDREREDERDERAERRDREREERRRGDEMGDDFGEERHAAIAHILDAEEIGGHARNFLLKAFGRMEDVDFREVWGFIKETFPERYREFRELSHRHADEAVAVMEHLLDESMHLLELRAENPREFERVMRRQALERDSHALAARVRDAENAEERAALREQLRVVLNASFDLKQELLQRDLEHLQGELERLEHIVNTREERRERIIDRRLQDLTEGEEIMAW